MRPRRILPVIVGSQFAGTSLWFAGNAVLDDLQREGGLPAGTLGYATSAVQLGFIAGTLLFAFFSIADLRSPRVVFFTCTLFGALANAGVVVTGPAFAPLLALRFATGFFLAGIYPVGMKIAAGWYREDLGKALGFLVGALVLGTSFPHLLRGLNGELPWQAIMLAVSALALAGGVAMLALVPDGPHAARAAAFDARAILAIFRSVRFRASAFGYFGHMWELYAFWAFLPMVVAAHAAKAGGPALDIPFWSFATIGVGAVGCVLGGLLSLRTGSASVARAQLLASGICCVLSPLLFNAGTPVFLGYLLFWGVVVAGDSPQFSALNAANAPRELVGSALTIANCLGFSITVASIELLNYLAQFLEPGWLYVLLTPGPLLGVLAMGPLLRGAPARTTR